MNRFSDYIAAIQDKIGNELPGETFQLMMAPAHRNTLSTYDTSENVRNAAVTVLLTADPETNEPCVLLIERSVYDGVHSGQIALPGGKPEPGEELADAALRELEEETGIPVSAPTIIGRLSPLFIPPSRFMVHPFVAFLEILPEIRPQEREVQSVFRLPLNRLDPSIAKTGKFNATGGVIISAPFFELEEGKKLWGATAMILSELYALHIK